MAPKRGKKKVKQVVKTRKVVEETVEVSIIGPGSQDEVAQAEAQTPTKVSERKEEHSSVTMKTIPIEDMEDDETETQEPEFPLMFERVSTPPRGEEARPKQDEPLNKDERAKKDDPQKQAKKELLGKVKKEKKNKYNKKRGSRMREKGGGREGYKSYVFKVLKQVHPGLAVSGKALTVINNLISDMFERLAYEAGQLSMHAKKQTLSARDIQGAVKLVLPGELGKHAIAEGTKAVTNYKNYAN